MAKKRKRRKAGEPKASEERILETLKRIEDLLEKLILFQVRAAGASRTSIAEWMHVDNNRIAGVSSVVKSLEKEKK